MQHEITLRLYMAGRLASRRGEKRMQIQQSRMLLTGNAQHLYRERVVKRAVSDTWLALQSCLVYGSRVFCSSPDSSDLDLVEQARYVTPSKTFLLQSV